MRREQFSCVAMLVAAYLRKLQIELSALCSEAEQLSNPRALTKQEHGKIKERDIVAEGNRSRSRFQECYQHIEGSLRPTASWRHSIACTKSVQETLQTISYEIDPSADPGGSPAIRGWLHPSLCFAVAGHRVLPWLKNCLGELDQAGVKIAKDVATQHFEQIGYFNRLATRTTGGNGVPSSSLGLGRY